MRYPVVQRKLICALALLLALAVPARAAGLWSWLTGQPDPTEAPASEAAFSDAPTLPPAEAILPGETPAPAYTPAPIPAAAIEDDGQLRVELRSLGYPAQLHLTLAGVYAVDADPGFRFERDTRVTLSAGSGSVYLSVGGLTIDMGQSVALTRHRAAEGEQNGVYIDESEKDTLYCGDLTVSTEGDGLRAVLKIQVEDYLYGVVAYEMSDSFPIEALKAQAVAARTYALQRKWQSGGREYDLVDTTADQVFKGYDASYVNVIEAVDATRGVVGLYDGGFAVCYYTASNGGQTALPSQVWDYFDGEEGYLAMADDPYDVENPRSLQNELTVTARCEGSAALKQMLEAALGDALAGEGYGAGEWEFDSIASITPVDPRFEGSRMYDGLRFELRAKLLAPVTTPEPTDTPEATDTPAATDTPEPTDAPESEDTTAPEETPEATDAPGSDDEQALEALAAALTGGEPMPTAPDAQLPEDTEIPREWVLSERTFPVTLSVYDQIKDGLNLGLNAADYELVSVDTQLDGAGAATGFTLVMRRFGHGVGMSQRGAQWMAGHYGEPWQRIVGFYYPGLSVERMDWPEEALTQLDALPDSVGAARPKPTPTPSPAPLPELEAGERYATVTATSLNVRERPTTSARAIAQLAKDRKVIVCSEPDADGWVSIRTAELEGFVKAEYLK